MVPEDEIPEEKVIEAKKPLTRVDEDYRSVI